MEIMDPQDPLAKKVTVEMRDCVDWTDYLDKRESPDSLVLLERPVFPAHRVLLVVDVVLQDLQDLAVREDIVDCLDLRDWMDSRETVVPVAPWV